MGCALITTNTKESVIVGPGLSLLVSRSPGLEYIFFISFQGYSFDKTNINMPFLASGGVLTLGGLLVNLIPIVMKLMTHPVRKQKEENPNKTIDEELYVWWQLASRIFYNYNYIGRQYISDYTHTIMRVKLRTFDNFNGKKTVCTIYISYRINRIFLYVRYLYLYCMGWLYSLTELFAVSNTPKKMDLVFLVFTQDYGCNHPSMS